MTILVVGVLSAGGLYSYAQYVDNSRFTAAKAEVAMINMAINQYDHVAPTNRCGSKLTTASSCISAVKDKNLLASDPSYDGKYGCTGSLYKKGKYVDGDDKYYYQYSGCNFAQGAVIQFE